MLQEIEYAAVWWASQLCPSKPLTEDQLQIFTVALQDELLNKYKNHWYADWPMRGQAYRAIHCNFPKGLIDDVLQKAAKQASIENCLDCFGQMDEHVQMWVDPGEVEVSYVHTHRTELIYQQQKSYRTTTSPRSTSPVHSSTRSRSPPVQPASPPSMMYYYTPQQQQQHFAFQDNVFMYSQQQQQQPSTLAQREAWSPAGQSALYRTGMQHV